MTKKEYLTQLTTALRDLNIEDREDIITEIENHFAEEKKAGTPLTSTIKKLGKPKTLAKTYLLENTVNDYKKTGSSNSLFRATLLAISLGFINLTFIIPFVVAIYAILISFFASGIAICLAVFVAWLFPQLTSLSTRYMSTLLPGGSYVLYILGLLLFGAGMVILSTLGLKNFTKAMINYIKTNLNIIRDK